MSNEPDWARARSRARFFVTIVVGAALVLDVFAVFVGAPDTDFVALTIAFVSAALVCGLPLCCFLMVNAVQRGTADRKPANEYAVVLQAVFPLLGVLPSAVVALVMGYQWAGVAATAAALIAAALLWPTENRMDLIMSGRARVYFPVVAA